MKAIQYLLALLALAGAVVSALALRVHYSTATEPCSINDRWDCGIVNHSSFSELGHLPVAAIGIAGYLLLIGLSLLRQRFPLFLAAVVGLGFALRLTLIEEYVLEVWCLYCVISQMVIAAITLLSLGWLTAEYLSIKRGASRLNP